VDSLKGNVLNFKNLVQGLRDFFYGMAALEFEQHAVAVRSSMESLFMAISFGDMLGLPIIPPYYSLRLLPFVVPSIATWKRRVLRERELTEGHDYDLHGV
jgi:hypothetical protein